MAYIELQNAGYRYPKGGFSINNISLKLFKDEFTAIKGPNGSGKTTLGKLLSGIFKPDSGCVYICGRDSKDMSLGEVGSKLGYLFQNPERQLFASTVREEISFVLDLKGVNEDEIEDRINYALDRFNLKYLEYSVPFKLSRGEKQRLAIAAVLVNQPEFLIFDEPTTGLDRERRDMLSDILEELKLQGMGMAVISHDEGFIDRHATRIIKMTGGDIVADYRK